MTKPEGLCTACGTHYCAEHAPSPATGSTADLRADLGLSIDMLDADRLRKWAENIGTYGPDITNWGSTTFVAAKLREMAANVEAAVRDIGVLRAVLASQAGRPDTHIYGCSQDGDPRMAPCAECDEALKWHPPASQAGRTPPPEQHCGGTGFIAIPPSSPGPPEGEMCPGCTGCEPPPAQGWQPNEDHEEVIRVARGLLDNLGGMYPSAAKHEFAQMGPQVMRDLLALVVPASITPRCAYCGVRQPLPAPPSVPSTKEEQTTDEDDPPTRGVMEC